MNLAIKFRDLLGGGLYPVQEELDNLVAGIQTGWNQEHLQDGTHTNMAQVLSQGHTRLGGPLEFNTKSVIAPALLAASVNDFNPSGWEAATIVKVGASVSTLPSITGLQAPLDRTQWRVKILIPTGVNNLTLKDQSTSTASQQYNRLYLGGADYLFGASPVFLVYDPTVSGWRPLVALANRGVFRCTTTGNIDDLDFGGADIIRMENASLATIRGLKSGGTDGQRVTIVSTNAQVETAHQNAGSTAAYRLINFATSANTPAAGGVGTFQYAYDIISTRWRLVAHEQGAAVTATYAGGNFTGNGLMTWGVDSGDIGTMEYLLRGRELTVKWFITATTVGGTPNTLLQIGNGAWGGFTAASTALASAIYNDNGAGNAGGFSELATTISTALLLLSKLSGNWTAAVNNTNVFGEITFAVT